MTHDRTTFQIQAIRPATAGLLTSVYYFHSRSIHNAEINAHYVSIRDSMSELFGLFPSGYRS